MPRSGHPFLGLCLTRRPLGVYCLATLVAPGHSPPRELPRCRLCRRKEEFAPRLTPPRTLWGVRGVESLESWRPLPARPGFSPSRRTFAYFSCVGKVGRLTGGTVLCPPVREPVTSALPGLRPARRPRGWGKLPKASRYKAGGRRGERRSVASGRRKAVLALQLNGGYPGGSPPGHALWVLSLV